MKKIILFLFFIFLLTGCGIEISDYEFVSGMAIDRIDDNYSIKIEVVNTKANKPMYITAQAKSLNNCISKIQDKSSKRAYFNHARLLIIGEEYAKGGIDSLIDFIMENGYRINMPVVISKGRAMDVLDENKKYDVVSYGIYDNLNGNMNYEGSFNIIRFYELYNDLLFNNSYSCIPICFKDNDDISVAGGAIMDNYRLGMYINKLDVDLIKIVNNKYKDNRVFVDNKEIKTNGIKCKIDVDDKIIVKLNNKEIIPYINDVIIKMLDNNIDPFDFDRKIYYKGINKYNAIKNDYIKKIKEYEVVVVYEG